MRILLIVFLAILLNACGSAMVLKTERVEADGSETKVSLKSNREYKEFELRYNPDTKTLEIRASDVSTGPNEWAPVFGKLVDKIPDVPIP